MPRLSLRCLWALLCFAWSECLFAFGSLPILQPADFRSPSGEYVWHVDPSERSGAGPATYTLRRNASPTFSGVLELTLRDAKVGDDGTLMGIAYSKGEHIDGGDFVVALVDASGALRELTREPRESSRYLHAPANPTSLGVVIDAPNARAIVRVGDADINRGSESWWIYSLPDGKAIERIQPRELQPDNAPLRRLWSVQALPETPLMLVQWSKTNSDYRRTDTRFALLDEHFKPVWTLDRPDEYRDARTREHVEERGAVLAIGPAQFALWLGAAGQRVDFEVSKSDTPDRTWQVQETARSPRATLDPAPPAAPAVAIRTLPRLGAIELDAGRPRAPAPFSDFSIDDRGRFGLLRCACGGRAAFQLLQADGLLLREFAMDFLPNAASDQVAVAWVENDRWLLVSSDQQHATGYWLDVETGSVQPVAELKSPPIKQLARDGLGGFVALTSWHHEHTIEESLRAFDATGRERWVVGDGYGDDAKLSSPEDLTVTTDGVVVVLENVVRQIKRFDRNGLPLGSTRLEIAWERKPNYPAGIEADATGGVIVYDFQGSPEFVHMRADGSVGDSYTPAMADGRRFRAIGNVQLGAAGRRWTSDGNALMQLAADGKVTQVIGTMPDGNTLEQIVAMHITRTGHIHAVDERSGAVHVFDANGERERTCLPAVNDYDEDLSLPSISVGDAGDIYVERSAAGSRPEYLHYSADCGRIGIETVGVDRISETWLAQPGGDRRWIVGMDKLFLVDADGKLLAEQTRDAQGAWLVDPEIPAAAADGSLVLYSGRNLMGDSAEANSAPAFVFFDERAKPLRQIPAPATVATWSPLSYDGRFVSFVAEVGEDRRAVHLAEAATGALWRVTEPSAKWIRAWLVQAATGPELWVFDGERGIDRLQLPPAAGGRIPGH